jgi:hypothetical protein
MDYRRLKELYENIRRTVEGARGSIVTLYASKFARDKSEEFYIHRILEVLCRRYGCMKLTGRRTKYMFNRRDLQNVSLDELTEALLQT